jgi:hypothetical protein
MHTPIRSRNHLRLVKTMDSVEILKKRRSTREKSKKNGKNAKEENESEKEENLQEDSSIKMTSMPVGKHFRNLKRRVTFKTQKVQIEKLRDC